MTIDERIEQLVKLVEGHAQLFTGVDARLEKIADGLEKVTERLEKLTEKHQALAKTVELVQASQQKTEKELRRLARFARAVLMDHEDRLADLEGNEEDKEGD